MDSRLKLLSHSSLCLLHTCPRKYQLQKLWPEYVKEESIHLSYGSMFGEGLQSLLAGYSLQESVLRASTHWNLDLFDFEKSKSFWHCIAALEKFEQIRADSALADYEVVMYNGKPACELGFCIQLPDGFYYRGYIDIVMQHKLDGSYLVVDAKTSGAKYSNPAKYQNSPQAIGYSTVMDVVAPDCNQFNVMYFEYLTELGKFVDHTFMVDYLSRANWIRDILLDVETMKMYDAYDEWKMHGESCTAYSRACQYIDCCTMKTANLVGNNTVTTEPFELDTSKGAKYDVYVTLEQLIESQMERM